MLSGVRIRSKVTFGMQCGSTIFTRPWCIITLFGFGTFLKLTRIHSALSWSTVVVKILTLFLKLHLYYLRGKQGLLLSKYFKALYT
uniref:Uncharacterized protein n=1 Tax=Salix viminalis TaxID=40686 RepID=A0A6N2L5R8_SALVM